MKEPYHHFKGKKLSRSELIQRRVIEILLKSKLSDDKRESSKIWEIKHSSGCCQVGRILAEKRGLNKEYAEIICVLHDIHVVVTGKYHDHAHLGAKYAEKMLNSMRKFSKKEIRLITEAIYHHSDKHVYSKNPYVELAKDADTLDCFLYDDVENYYIIQKKPEVAVEYFKRINKIRKELGIKELDKYKKIIEKLKAKKLKMGLKLKLKSQNERRMV